MNIFPVLFISPKGCHPFSHHKSCNLKTIDWQHDAILLAYGVKNIAWKWMGFEYIWLFDVHHLETPVLMLAIIDFFLCCHTKQVSFFLSFIVAVFCHFTEAILISMWVKNYIEFGFARINYSQGTWLKIREKECCKTVLQHVLDQAHHKL